MPRDNLIAAALAAALMATAPAMVRADPGGVDIHGMVSQGYMRSTEYDYLIDTKEGTLALTEFAINLTTNVTPRLRIGGQLLGRDYGRSGNSRVTVDWAMGDYWFNDLLGVRIGMVKTPFGLYGQARDIDMVRNPVLLPQSVYSEDYRAIMLAKQGLGIYGSLTMGSGGALEYEALVGTHDLDEARRIADNTASLNPDGNMLSIVFETRPTLAAALRWDTPLEGLRLGGSWYDFEDVAHAGFDNLGRMKSATSGKEWYILSAEYTAGNLQLAAELRRLIFDVDIDLLDQPPPINAMHVHLDTGGYYGQAVYRFSPWFELGAYYSMNVRDWHDQDGHWRASPENPSNVRFNPQTGQFEPLPADELPQAFEGWLKDICFTARFDIASFWILKLETHALRGVGSETIDTSTIPAGEGLDEHWQLFAVKSTFFF